MTDIDALIARVLELDAEATPHAEWYKVVAAERARDARLLDVYRTAAPQLARECQRLRERVAELEQDISYLSPSYF